MDPTGKTFTSEDPRRWIGRIIMAVILGEAIWNLIVSVMNNLVVPWLGDLFGQSSGLPTSFTQRPYNYPDLFVSILEFCIAGLIAAIINYFFQRPRPVRVKTAKSEAPIAPVEPLRVVPRSEPPASDPQSAMTAATTTQPTLTQPVLTQATRPVAPPVPVAKPAPIIPAAPVIVAPSAPAPPVAPAPVAKPVAVAPAAPSVPVSAAKPQPPPPKAQPAKPTKTKEVYYNIVGEPMPSDDE
ncbi:MAG: hypothetical protein WB755_22855 [Terriglobales bacterium]|jgi:hypothetical protein